MNIEITFDSDRELHKFINGIEENKNVTIAGNEYAVEDYSTGFFGNLYLRLKRVENG